ncbi:DEAD/DEAH box helicase domain-containing protein [Kribbella sp. VKM Ac-2527]|uniref:DEAD/DEAH box helicase domain-containing protein n=1 Tax=Kribbella caucasensis TaxID=2512215 RepID=A0A4R6KIH6_9ACTN|nr:DEAD/DEAH box helicase [Kribbella sp. VKM Ac-2527]TDO50834.1 DEAD/DEAH box helicase domain-containing protein [Kribbella sp. VKM Ac-2527]
MGSEAATVLKRLAAGPGRAERLTHVESVPPRAGQTGPWPRWVPPDVLAQLADAGVVEPWSHQVATAEAAYSGQHVVVATGTASGKSLGYLLPAFATLSIAQAASPHRRTASVLYLSPTKALAHDQLRAISQFTVPGLRPTTLDGDSERTERDWARDHATYVLSNPDMLHRSVLPNHQRWARFLACLQYVVVDECHHYRGVFGAHVAGVLRRLRRICAHYGAHPIFVCASATVAEPAVSGERLTGLPMVEVTEDGSPRGGISFGLWEPPLTSLTGENGAPVRRSATAEVADLLTDLVVSGVRTVAFVRSRRGAETVALTARDNLAEVDPSLVDQVSAYRAGYLPEERRRLEGMLQSGELTGVAATNALELGIDIAGLDAVLLAGWPGTRASLWQQAGRAGRSGGDALALLVARDDPLDTFLVRHPQAIFGRPVEATVFNPENPYVLGPQLCAAAQELPLTSADYEIFGATTESVIGQLVRQGLLRERPHGWFWTRRERAVDAIDIRSAGGKTVQIVEDQTGRLLGTVDGGSAHASVHTGAVYVHAGESYLVRSLDLEGHAAIVEQASPDYTTFARDVTEISILATEDTTAWGSAELSRGWVQVTSQVISFQRKQLVTGDVLDEQPLDLPERTLRTKAVWWTMPDPVVAQLGLYDVPGAAHAAEHASIGLLPLFATCDRWDIGGVSTARHPDTGCLTVFVYDGHPGGAGFAEHGYGAAREWLTATREAIAHCECVDGCPSCVQSPKCGNGNNPLDKGGAVALLTALLGSEA